MLKVLFILCKKFLKVDVNGKNVWARHLCQVLLRASHPSLNCGKIFFQPFSTLSLLNFLFALHMIHPPSPLPSSSFFLLSNILCVCVRVCARRYASWLLPSHISTARLSSVLFIPACLCQDSGGLLIFKHQIQKLVFPPLRAGSHWDRAGMAHHANEASFMGASNNGSLQKSVHISVDARKLATFLSISKNLHRERED